jgi:MFS family permease
VAAALVLRQLPESFGPNTTLDIRGLALITAGILGIVWALVRGNAVGWASAEIVAALVGGGVLVMAFLAWEKRARWPMIPLHLFRSRAFSAGNAAMFCTFASLFAAVFFFAQLLQSGLGYGPLAAGLRLFPWTVTFITVAPIAGTLADRIGERPLMTTGLLLQAGGMAWIATIAGPDLSYTSLLGPLVMAGVGISMAIPAAQNSVVGSVADDLLGKAAGVNSMMRELGGVFGVAVAAAVFSGAGHYGSVASFMNGFEPAIGASAAFALAGAATALLLPGRTRTASTGVFDARVLEGTAS